MAYDKAFYDAYREYLKEESVRVSHDFIFGCFQKMAGENLYVIDFGCGLGEYWQYGCPLMYTGVDVNDFDQKFKLINLDYHGLDAVQSSINLRFVPNAFVSLFSVECFHSVQDRYEFYRKVFQTFPQISFGLVGGFFYEGKRDQETVEETGGIVSYQTIEDPALYISDIFTEFRLHIKTPSQMFGSDVIEVWKIFIRR